MTIVKTVQEITNWLNSNVCNKIKLKLPDDYNNTEEYTLREVNPTAFPLFTPTKEKLPPNVEAPFPSVCVQLLEGNDKLAEHVGTMKLELSFTTWNPGEHTGELSSAVRTTSQVGDVDYSVTLRGDGGSAAQEYTRNADGWMDVWNFVDVALAAIENEEYLNGFRVQKETGIQFGQFQVEGAIADLYPYWGAWVIFSVERGIARAENSTSQFL